VRKAARKRREKHDGTRGDVRTVTHQLVVELNVHGEASQEVGGGAAEHQLVLQSVFDLSNEKKKKKKKKIRRRRRRRRRRRYEEMKKKKKSESN